MWRRVLIRYGATVTVLNAAWEIAHAPLYTLWRTDPPGQVAFAIAHCTGGDVLIALAVLMAALTIVGSDDWPRRGYWRVATVATLLGLGYTVYSEWLNTAVRQSWAYTGAMPLVPPLGTGLSPLLQWLILPPLGFWLARRLVIPPRGDAQS